MHPRAVVAEIDSLSLTTFAGYFLNYCKTIVEKHDVTVLLCLSQIMLQIEDGLVFLLAFLYREKLKVEI